ncbi:MAG: hypothetical protein WKF64_13120 [Ilumatobacteraceae bacterium]
MTISTRPARSRRLLGAIGVGILALTACNSTPSAKRVALDIVETMDSISDTQKQCLREKIDSYDSSALEEIGEAQENQALDFTDADALENATPELRAFVEDLRTSCLTDGS